MSYLDELNAVQRQAVEHINGPVMIIAGPGSGKTRVLTYRVAHLINQGVDSFNILALNFTNKAAREMRERVEKIVGNEARNLWMGTFHSIFARALRYDADKLGYPSSFSIYDTQDSKSLIKTIVKEQNLSPDLYKPNIVFNRISSAKNSLLTPKDYQEDFNIVAADEASGRPKIGYLYQLYAQRCFQSGAMDFDDLLMKMYQLLMQFPEALYKYQQKFKYIMIDEFQDTNYAQYEIVRLLAAAYENIGIVGDDAQSIYGFRGASIQNILNFEKDYPDLKVFKLEQNYRSTASIVKIANQVITKNKNQLPKQIWTENEDGFKAKLIKTASDNEEGKVVADSIFEQRLRNHYKNKDFAILYRTNAQSRAFEESLRKMNIPYVVYGGLSFYQRKEIKDLLAYMKLTVNHYDEEALRRIINYPTRGIGKTSMEKATIIASETGNRLWDVIDNIQLYNFNARTVNAIGNFVTMIKSYATFLETKDAYEVAAHIADSTGILKSLYADKSVEGLSRYENIQELLNSIKEFTDDDEANEVNELNPDKGLGTYLQQVSLLTDQDSKSDDDDTVKLMTIHAAKGLEFACVHVVGLEEELFPSRMSLNTREDLEEERRLFYVAVTRAERRLFLSYAECRYRFGNLNFCEPSRFIDEIAAGDLDVVGSGRPKPSYPSSSKANANKWEKPAFNKVSSSSGTFKKQEPVMPRIVNPNFQASDTSALQIGNKVEHQRFGKGNVLNIEGTGTNKIVTIDFNALGQKRIVLKFAKLQILN